MTVKERRLRELEVKNCPYCGKSIPPDLDACIYCITYIKQVREAFEEVFKKWLGLSRSR